MGIQRAISNADPYELLPFGQLTLHDQERIQRQQDKTKQLIAKTWSLVAQRMSKFSNAVPEGQECIARPGMRIQSKPKVGELLGNRCHVRSCVTVALSNPCTVVLESGDQCGGFFCVNHTSHADHASEVLIENQVSSKKRKAVQPIVDEGGDLSDMKLNRMKKPQLEHAMQRRGVELRAGERSTVANLKAALVRKRSSQQAPEPDNNDLVARVNKLEAQLKEALAANARNTEVRDNEIESQSSSSDEDV